MHLKKINYDFERIQYNTVVSGCNEIFNVLQKVGEQAPHAAALLREGVGILLRVQYPITPHVTHALWTELGYAARHGDILDAPWPQVDESALVQDEIELVLQVNGKLRGHIRVAAGAAREAIEAAALATEEFKRHANGASPKKIVIVPGRLVNMVL
jgi:leucyl-tRNA synthetase